MTWRRRLGLVVTAAAMGLTAFATSQGIAQAAINSDEAPHPGNSSPNDAHTFLLRKSSNFGKNPDVQLVAYYPKDINNTQWSNAYLKLRPGGRLTDPLVCQSSGGGGTVPARYITVTLTREDTGAQLNYRIPYDNACKYDDPDHTNQNGENNRNQLFGRYYLPGRNAAPIDGNVNPTTNKHHVYVTIRYHDSIPENVDNTGNTAQFDVKGNTTGLKIGQLGGGEAEDDTTDGYSFPLRPDYAHVRANPGESSAVDIPFGLPCNVVGGGLREKRIGLFDADNGADPFMPYRVQFRVKEVGGDYLKFVSGTEKKAEIRNSGYVLRPWDGEAAYASAKIRMKTQTNYVMEITGIANGNIIDVHVPGDTIYGDIDCKWEMRPDSSVSPTTQRPNGWVTFTHTATNIKAFKSDPVTSKVKWGKRGVNTTGTVSTDANRIYNPNNNTGSRTFTDSFRIPATATNGQEYCQYLEVQPHSYNDNTAYDSWQKGDRACVRVGLPPPPPDEAVRITPVVDDGPDIEPTEKTTLNGRAVVNNFPPYSQWGYNEYSKRLDAQRVTAQMTNDGIGSQTRTVYTCPSGYSPTNPTTNTSTSCSKTVPGTTTYYCPHGVDTERASDCKHARTGTANDTKKECEANGNTWSGGSCYSTHAKSSSTSPSTKVYTWPSSSTQTRYRCEDPTAGSWGAWGGGVPTTCKKQYTCPGGARVKGTNSTSAWRTSKPLCDGWKCAYSPYQFNQPTAPTCQYRCNGGTGPVALSMSNGQPSNGLSSIPCIQPPSFTLTCTFVGDTTVVVSSTVRSNGIYCYSSVQRTGATVGMRVCAVLTPNQPTSWSANVQPGYGNGGTNPNAPYSQLKRWGWQVSPASDNGCSRVVAKPTVKIFGGDIAAGGGFVVNGVCGPSASSMIAGWPHAPNYDASGTQFGAFSTSTITGFSSAMVNANSARPPRSLAFANTPASGGEVFGGGFGNIDCAIDHYGDATPASLPNIGLSSINSSPTTPTPSGSYRGSGTQIGHNPVIRNGQRIAVYTTGNVYISGSGITYQNRGSWQTVQDIPAFKLVVYGANIYIAPSVTELSGIYVAQPNGNVGGEIYTCANNGSAIPNNSLYGSCRNLLTVNGAFIAKKVHLQRTEGTAIRGETAEHFNYLPEVWLAPWPQTNSADEVKYDAIISLPPVL